MPIWGKVSVVDFSSVKEKVFGVKTTHRDISAYLEAQIKGDFAHMHFGYWINGTEDFITAQNNLYYFIKNFIDPCVKSILDIGG